MRHMTDSIFARHEIEDEKIGRQYVLKLTKYVCALIWLTAAHEKTSG